MTTTELGPVSVLCQDEGSNTRDKEEWKQVTAWSCKKSPSLPSELPLQNRYEALNMVDKGHDEMQKEESVQVLFPRSDQPTSFINSCITTSTKEKQWRVMVIGDSLPSRREAHICRLDLLFREICWLPGVSIRELTRKLTSLVQTLDYHPLLVFHMGTNAVAPRSPRSIKRDFRALIRS